MKVKGHYLSTKKMDSPVYIQRENIFLFSCFIGHEIETQTSELFGRAEWSFNVKKKLPEVKGIDSRQPAQPAQADVNRYLLRMHETKFSYGMTHLHAFAVEKLELTIRSV